VVHAYLRRGEDRSVSKARIGNGSRQDVGVPLSRNRRRGPPSSAPASRPARPTSFAGNGDVQFTGGVPKFKDKLVTTLDPRRAARRKLRGSVCGSQNGLQLMTSTMSNAMQHHGFPFAELDCQFTYSIRI